ncbi:MAG TPA: MarR family transcriptional regulator [Gaiellaceae bacterium]|nr:MarR family transcriptional regulator [Gaiellaceae bacterium]
MSRQEKISRGIELVRRNQVLTQMLDELGAEYLGINTTDGRALDVIDQAGRITAGDLARELRLSTGAVTAIVDRLEKAGFARRVADPDDRRRVLIEATPAVQRLSVDIYGDYADAIDWAKGFTEAELDVILRFQDRSTAWLERRLAHVQALLDRRSAVTTRR